MFYIFSLMEESPFAFIYAYLFIPKCNVFIITEYTGVHIVIDMTALTSMGILCSLFFVSRIAVQHLKWQNLLQESVWTGARGEQPMPLLLRPLLVTCLNTCASRSHYNRNITIKLDLFHCIRRFLRECVSEHHPLYSSFSQFLSAAFSVVDQEDLQRLKDAYTFCGIQPAYPTMQHTREHCGT